MSMEGSAAVSGRVELDGTSAGTEAHTSSHVPAELPDRVNEAWHYGDPRKFAIGDLEVAAKHASPVLPDIAKELADTEYFAAQHFANTTETQLITLARNQDAGTIHLELAALPAQATFHTLRIVAEAFSSAELYVHFSGGADDGRSLHSVMLFAELTDGARVSVTRVQHYGGRTDAILREHATVSRDAYYTSTVVQLGGLNIRSEAHLELAASGAVGHLRGAYLAAGRQRFDFLTHQNHQAPHATSNLLYKGALLGRSRASYQGLITVAEHAQRTDAYQSNRTLVLSKSARADSSPQLEIKANDVRCTHGSTVSNVGERELFYMQARGIPREQARRLLIAAFIAEVTDQVPDEAVRRLAADYAMELTS